MVKIRLVRSGSKKRPFYQIVIADSRFSRNGRFIEKIGFFNPLFSSTISKNFFKNVDINITRIQYWLKNGAIMSDRVKYLLTKKIKSTAE